MRGLRHGVTERLADRGIAHGTTWLTAVSGAAIWAVLVLLAAVFNRVEFFRGLSAPAATAIIAAAFAAVIAATVLAFSRLFHGFGTGVDADLRRLLAAERETVQRLTELRRARTEIVTQVAHEIRTPLTTLQGSGQVLAARQDELSAEERAVLISAIQRAGDRLNELPELLDRVMQPEDPEGLRELAREHPSG